MTASPLARTSSTLQRTALCSNAGNGCSGGDSAWDEMIQNLAKMRSVGGNLFVWFGLLSYAWFIFSRWFMMKEEIPIKNGEEKPSSWMSKSEVAAE